MEIMIIFLILSITLAIGTAVYLSYKKQNTNKQIKQNPLEIEKIRSIQLTNKKHMSDILSIRINGNMICLGNRYSSIVRLGNIDYNMLSDSEQDVIENILIQTALSIDYPVQFLSTTEYIDTSKAIKTIKENKVTNKRIKEYQEFLTEYLQRIMENKNISIIKNYAIISYDGTYESAIEELNRKCLSFKGNLLRAKIMCEVLNENELYNLIYRELNKNSTLNISSLKEGGKNLYVGKKQKSKREK